MILMKQHKLCFITLVIAVSCLYLFSSVKIEDKNVRSLTTDIPKESLGSPPTTTISYPTINVSHPVFSQYGFESGTFETWTPGNGAIITTEKARFGTYSVKLVAPGTINTFIWKKMFAYVYEVSFYAMASPGAVGWFFTLVSGPPEHAKGIIFMYRGAVVLGDTSAVDSPTAGTNLTTYIPNVWYKFSIVRYGLHGLLIYMNDYLISNTTLPVDNDPDAFSVENLYTTYPVYVDNISICTWNYLPQSSFVKTTTDFTLTASDPDVDANASYYQVDDNGYALYGTPFTLGIAVNGSHKIDYFSTDIGGNNETVNTIFVNLDSNAPASTINRTAGYVSNSTIFTITAVDGAGETGIEQTNYTINGVLYRYYGPFHITGTPGASISIVYWTIDRNGNNETAPAPMTFIFLGNEINIQSDDDWYVYAQSGNGISSNPWILNGYDINGNGTGTCVTITNTDDYAIIENSNFTNGGNAPTDAIIILLTTKNIEFVNCNASNNNLNPNIVVIASGNINVTNSTFNNASINFFTEGSWEIHVINSTFINGTVNIYASNANFGNGSTRVDFVNCTVSEPQNGSGRNMYLSFCTFYNISGCSFVGGISNMIMTTAINVLINASIFDMRDAIHVIVCYASDIIYKGNIFYNLGITLTAIYLVSSPDNVSIIENQFTSFPLLLITTGTNINVSRNFFTNITQYCQNSSSVGWNGNYYRNYFYIHPYDVTVNVTTDILSYALSIGNNIIDHHPRYHAPWYPRNQIVNLQFDSSITLTELPFSHLIVHVDGIRITTVSLIINHVLFHVTITMANGHVYLDKMYNINSTGMYLQDYLDIVPQIFITFYSTIDGFGLDFTLVRLYIDNIRTTRDDPVMLPEITHVVLTDFLNVTLYNQHLNLSTTGVYIDIGIPIALITWVNYHNYTIVVSITRANTTQEITLGAGANLQMRFALGSYSLQVFASNNTLIESRTVVFSSLNKSSFVVNFGFAAITLPTPGPEPLGYTFLDTIISVAVFAGIVFIVMLGYNMNYFKKIKNTFTTKRPS